MKSRKSEEESPFGGMTTSKVISPVALWDIFMNIFIILDIYVIEKNMILSKF